eukprot:scaffold141318_cov32-Tisochrysis_lutea.AAC.2
MRVRPVWQHDASHDEIWESALAEAAQCLLRTKRCVGNRHQHIAPLQLCCQLLSERAINAVVAHNQQEATARLTAVSPLVDLMERCSGCRHPGTVRVGAVAEGGAGKVVDDPRREGHHSEHLELCLLRRTHALCVRAEGIDQWQLKKVLRHIDRQNFVRRALAEKVVGARGSGGEVEPAFLTQEESREGAQESRGSSGRGVR